MTHDELLAKINNELGMSDAFRGFDALCAVVELHIAVGRGYQIELQQGKYVEGLCSHCGWAYPCPTIQAIEKELK